MKIEIKNRYNGNVILCGEYESIKDCLEKNRDANFAGADLADADLAGAYLSGANLAGADLSDANLSGANLAGADLAGAYLAGAYLAGAYLSGANLAGANLAGAYLSGADLSGANLADANFADANLSGANLAGANLAGAYLSGADLAGADLSDANLSDAKNISIEKLISLTTITPEGELIGWKKCNNNIIVKVKIPYDAKRSNSTGRKCRAEYVEVLDIIGGEVGISQHDNKTEYRKGEIVKCEKWDDNRWNECSGGIHFFLTEYEARNY